MTSFAVPPVAVEVEPCITAAVCTYGRYDLLDAALDSLLGQRLPEGSFRIVVVDNTPSASADGPHADRLARGGRVEYIAADRPGLSHARNLAIRCSQTPYVAFMDDDAVADPSWLEALVAAFETGGEDVAIVGGRVRPRWGAPRPHWLTDDLLGHVSVVDWGGGQRFADRHEWFAGTNIAFRTRVLVETGGFSIKLGRQGGHALLSNEETEIANRLRDAGWRLVYAPEAIVDHLVDPQRLTQAWFRKRASWQAISDSLSAPARHEAAAEEYRESLLDYVNARPPDRRSLAHLFEDCLDGAALKLQLDAAYCLTCLLTSGRMGSDS